MSTNNIDIKAKHGPVIWGAGILGVLAGKYAGINLLIPLAGAAATFYALKKLASAQKAIWFGAISVQVGHAIWFLVGLAIEGQITPIIWDPVLLLLGALWLLLRPGIAPVISLSLFQIAALLYNAHIFLGTDFGSNANRALFVHIVFRALALGLMFFALRKSRINSQAQVASP